MGVYSAYGKWFWNSLKENNVADVSPVSPQSERELYSKVTMLWRECVSTTVYKKETFEKYSFN